LSIWDLQPLLYLISFKVLLWLKCPESQALIVDLEDILQLGLFEDLALLVEQTASLKIHGREMSEIETISISKTGFKRRKAAGDILLSSDILRNQNRLMSSIHSCFCFQASQVCKFLSAPIFKFTFPEKEVAYHETLIF